MAYYNEIAPIYNQLHGEEQLRKLRAIHAFLTEHKLITTSDTILDVGCGTGLSAQVFKNNIVGVDPAQELLKQASFKTVCARAEQLPFPDNSFDVVLCITALHNCDDPCQAIAEMKRVGKRIWVITLLKKSAKRAQLEKLLSTRFRIVKVIDDVHDRVFFARNMTLNG